MTCQCQLALQHIRRTAKFLLPKTVANHDAGCATTTHVVGRIQHPAHQWFDTEHVEELSAHPECSAVADLPTFGQINSAGAPREHPGERLLAISQLLPEWIGKRVVSVAVAAAPVIRSN